MADFTATVTLGSRGATGSTETKGRGLARILKKMSEGTNVKITFLGDSIMEGTTATTPGNDDAASLLCSALASRYSVTVTKSNRCAGGTTAYNPRTSTRWASAITDNADLYVISFAKNDIVGDAGVSFPTSLTGYPKAYSLAQVESMVREIRYRLPNADIMLMSTNPYSSAYSTSNANQWAYTIALRGLAAAYDCEYCPGFEEFPGAGVNGATDSYLSDGVHPNSLGHAALYGSLLARFPSTWTLAAAKAQGAILAPAAPMNRTVYSLRQTRSGFTQLSSASLSAYTSRIDTGALAGSWTGTGPWTSSTADSYLTVTVLGSEVLLDFTMGAGQGVVQILPNGIPLSGGNVDLSTLTNGKLLAITGLLPGVNTVVIKVVSGTVVFNGAWYAGGAGEFIAHDAARVTSSGMGSPATLGGGYNRSGIATAAAGSLTVPFVGTGLTMQVWRSTGGGGVSFFTSLTIDGSASTTPSIASTSFVRDGVISLASGLPYGPHTAVVTFAAAGLYVCGFCAIDENPELRRSECQGSAIVGETVRFPYPNTTAPHVSVQGASNLAGASAVTTTQFVPVGTSSEAVRWRCVTNDPAFY